MITSLVKYIKELFDKDEEETPSVQSSNEMKPDTYDNGFYTFITVDDVPDIVEARKVYVVGENKREWLAVLECPCGCKDIIQLNLLKDAEPNWRVMYHKSNRISIFPSIRRIRSCYSHFTITKGRLRWWGESPD